MAINRSTGMTFLDLVVSGLGPSCYVTHEPDGVAVLWGPVEDIRRAQESVAYLTGMGTASIVEDAVARMFLPSCLVHSGAGNSGSSLSSSIIAIAIQSARCKMQNKGCHPGLPGFRNFYF